MRQRQAGRIIFMNAIGGVLTTAFLGAYCASKHALDCLAAVFDLELRPFGIRVSSVYPSAFHTAIADNMRVVSGAGSPYAESTEAYQVALTGRIHNGPADLSPGSRRRRRGCDQRGPTVALSGRSAPGGGARPGTCRARCPPHA